MRNAGVWTYGIVNLTHILGVSSLFGAVLVLDLRLLGLWRSVPLASIARPTVPIATTGFIVAATSGLCLISTNGSEYIGNPFLRPTHAAQFALGGQWEFSPGMSVGVESFYKQLWSRVLQSTTSTAPASPCIP